MLKINTNLDQLVVIVLDNGEVEDVFSPPELDIKVIVYDKANNHNSYNNLDAILNDYANSNTTLQNFT